MRWWWCLFCTRPTLYSWILIVLTHYNNNPQVDMPHHWDTLSWLRGNQSLLLFLNVVCSVKKQQISILKSFTWPNQGSNPQSTKLQVSMLTNYVTKVVELLSTIQFCIVIYAVKNWCLFNDVIPFN